jgi:hypothetical protein
MKILSSAVAAVFCLFIAYAAEATHTYESIGDQKSDYDKARFTKHFNESLFQISGKGEFSVEIMLDDKEYSKLGKDVMGIVIHNKEDKDVEGARLTIVLINDKGKDIAGSPVIKEKGEGLYIVSNLNLPKEGNGQLMVVIKNKDVADVAVFSLPAAMTEHFPTGKYTQ